jgi:DNA polymerase
MGAERHDLLLHLQNAAFGYGMDLLLQVPARTTKPQSEPAGDLAAKPIASVAAPLEPRRMPWERGGDRQTSAPVDEPTSRDVAPPPVAVPAAAPQVAIAAPARTAATPAAAAQAEDPLLRLRAEAMACRKCKLCDSRKSVVFGEGTRHPEVLFVGEAPGAVEDQTGRPFVGPAGQLLDKILEGAMGYRREDVYIANINKCRPPGNRDPEPDEVAACMPFLRQQVALLQPKVIVALGRVAAHNLLGTDEPMRALRGRELSYDGIPVVVTWHPAFLLRDPSRKPETWQDIKRVNRMLGRPEDPRQANSAEA